MSPALTADKLVTLRWSDAIPFNTHHVKREKNDIYRSGLNLLGLVIRSVNSPR